MTAFFHRKLKRCFLTNGGVEFNTWNSSFYGNKCITELLSKCFCFEAIVRTHTFIQCFYYVSHSFNWNGCGEEIYIFLKDLAFLLVPDMGKLIGKLYKQKIWTSRCKKFSCYDTRVWFSSNFEFRWWLRYWTRCWHLHVSVIKWSCLHNGKMSQTVAR